MKKGDHTGYRVSRCISKCVPGESILIQKYAFIKTSTIFTQS